MALPGVNTVIRDRYICRWNEETQTHDCGVETEEGFFEDAAKHFAEKIVEVKKMDKEKEISVIANAIGWEMYHENKEITTLEDGVGSIHINDEETAKIRRAAERVWNHLNRNGD